MLALRSRSARALAAVRALASEADRIIQIDRSGLFKHHDHAHGAAAAVDKEPETAMARHLKSLIRFRGGPITLAEYMSEVLTNAEAGYYTQRDVFGAGGDFTTSPEISQMFGEMVGIWCVAMWEQMGRPPALRLVELGPGRGTLMADLLRGTAPFADFAAALSVALVEVSPALQQRQWEALRCGGARDAAAPAGRSGLGGAAVSWHRSLEEVPREAAGGGPTLYIAHEFVDALPVHQFQRSDRAWCERLVDAASPDSPLHLRLVLSPGTTPATRALLPRRLEGLPVAQRAGARALEVCPQGMALAEELAARVAAHGGAALIVDYGQDGPYDASLQAIRDHKFVGLLEQPGMADLSARVDFGALRHAVAAGGAAAACHGPIPQAHLLMRLGIQERLQRLVDVVQRVEEAEALVAGAFRLVSGGVRAEAGAGAGAAAAARRGAGPDDPGDTAAGAAKQQQEEGMGFTYKAICIAPADAPVPVAFDVLSPEEARMTGLAASVEVHSTI